MAAVANGTTTVKDKELAVTRARRHPIPTFVLVLFVKCSCSLTRGDPSRTIGCLHSRHLMRIYPRVGRRVNDCAHDTASLLDLKVRSRVDF